MVAIADRPPPAHRIIKITGVCIQRWGHLIIIVIGHEFEMQSKTLSTQKGGDIIASIADFDQHDALI